MPDIEIITLRVARCRFTQGIAYIIGVALALGFEIALDEGMDRITPKDPTSDHMPNSLHLIGLAQDLDLYKEGKYLMDTLEYTQLGEAWEALGRSRNWPLAWGGRFSKPDGNHFSWEWQGRR